MNAKEHHLFKTYPLKGAAALSIGNVPTPYHIYNGYGLFIGGVADLEVVKNLLKNEAVTPITTSIGQAVMGIWICDFLDASLGAHHELQFSFFVTEQKTNSVPFHPLNTLALMLTRPDIRMVCYGLWNNTPTVVAYNREHLSLNAILTDSHIERSAHSVRFHFQDQATGTPILSGQINDPQKTSFATTLALMGQIGLRTTWAVTQRPWVSLNVVNPVGVVLNRNAIAQAHTKNDVNVVRYFDPRRDSLNFGDTVYRSLHFTPHCVQYMDGFKFVYLDPQ